MDKLKMHTPNKADENFKKLAELFPNAVTETIDENGEVVRAIDKNQFFWQMRLLPKHCVRAVKKVWVRTALRADSIPKTSISRAITWKCSNSCKKLILGKSK